MPTIYSTTYGGNFTLNELAQNAYARGLKVTLTRPLPPVAMIAARGR